MKMHFLQIKDKRSDNSIIQYLLDASHKLVHTSCNEFQFYAIPLNANKRQNIQETLFFFLNISSFFFFHREILRRNTFEIINSCNFGFGGDAKSQYNFVSFVLNLIFYGMKCFLLFDRF